MGRIIGAIRIMGLTRKNDLPADGRRGVLRRQGANAGPCAPATSHEGVRRNTGVSLHCLSGSPSRNISAARRLNRFSGDNSAGDKVVEQNENDYLKGGKTPPATGSSLLISSSKYLNSARLRDIVAHEMLRKYGNDLPPAYLIPEAIEAFGEVADHAATLALYEREKQLKPEFKSWLEARYISRWDAQALALYAPGTLGAEIHAFITQSGFDIEFMFKGEPKDDHAYFNKRYVQGHDIEHMVTGFGPDPMGEYALMLATAQSYYHYFSEELAGELTRFNMFLLTSGVLRSALHYCKTMPLFFEAITLGLEMGRRMKKPLVFMRWEDYLDWPMAELRADLNIVGSPAKGAWDWSFDEMRG